MEAFKAVVDGRVDCEQYESKRERFFNSKLIDVLKADFYRLVFVFRKEKIGYFENARHDVRGAS